MLFKNAFISPFIAFFFLIIKSFPAFSQSQYADSSILKSGKWIKIAIANEGVYKIDVAFLKKFGLANQVLPTSQIRLYGHATNLLPENNSEKVIDDLREIALYVQDGSDGFFNNADYALFYAHGSNLCAFDSLANTYRYTKNIYSDTVYYFLTVSESKDLPKRMDIQPEYTRYDIEIDNYDYRILYEVDAYNLLNSGKVWLGEGFGKMDNLPLQVAIPVDTSNIVRTGTVQVKGTFVSRSVGTSPSVFTVSANKQAVATLHMPILSGGFLDAFAATDSFQTVFPYNDFDNLEIRFAPATNFAQGWLDWISVSFPKKIKLSASGTLFFRSKGSVGANRAASFTLAQANAATMVWDITQKADPIISKLLEDKNKSQFHIINDASVLREYVAFHPATIATPKVAYAIDNQNLHAPTQTDYLLITAPKYVQQAHRLAQFHTQRYRRKVLVVTTHQIANEFAVGVDNPIGIRNFIKMHYLRRKDTAKTVLHVCLLGAGNVNYKSAIRNNASVPCYESNNSFNPLLTYTSDDFFAFLDNDEQMDVASQAPIPTLDVAVGRLPVTNEQEAKQIVDKILAYHQPASLGNWRNKALFVADDKDYNLHVQDAEYMSNLLAQKGQYFNQQKLYLDAFTQETSANGSMYPLVNKSIINLINRGTLLVNYTGHGGYERLADETIFAQNEVLALNNAQKLPLFVTATCDFLPFDNPEKTSLGQQLLLGSANGAIALMASTRIVFANSNKIMNAQYLATIFQKNRLGAYLTMGEAAMAAKNATYVQSSDFYNNRKFALLGDPGIQLALPAYNILIDSVVNENGLPTDTLCALEKYVFKGSIREQTGAIVNHFNGQLNIALYDKPQTITTLGNSTQSPPTTFQQQNNCLFNGVASVYDGVFTFSVVLPKNKDNLVGRGKLSLYAADTVRQIDAWQSDTSLVIGIPSKRALVADTKAPKVQVYLNDTTFTNGRIVNNKPLLLVQLSDESGIQIAHSGEGNQPVAFLDGDENNKILLNDYYVANANEYGMGTIQYVLGNLNAGFHTLTLQVWDVWGNATQTSINFIVVSDNQLVVKNVKNYPNPFSGTTHFSFEHNQPNQNLDVTIDIYNLYGAHVHHLQQVVNTPGNVCNSLSWDAQKISGFKLTRGIYIYRIIVHSKAGIAQTAQKLFLH